LKLWDKVKDAKCTFVASDDWKSYKKFVPKEKHVITKAETCAIEGFNATVRHYLARFRRKTKCYSKSIEMVEYSLNLLFRRKELIEILSD